MQCSQLASSSPPTLSRVDVSPSCTEPGGMAKHECEITMPHAATCWRTCIPTCMHARDMLNLRHCTAHIEPPGRLTLLPHVASQPALPCIWQASLFGKLQLLHACSKLQHLASFSFYLLQSGVTIYHMTSIATSTRCCTQLAGALGTSSS